MKNQRGKESCDTAALYPQTQHDVATFCKIST